MKVDGEGRLSPFASGFRSPAGIGMNASDELFITDNQGDWVASSYLGHVEADDFLGHPATLWDREAYGITSSTLNYQNVDQRVDNHIYRGDEQGDALNHHYVALIDATNESCPKPW